MEQYLVTKIEKYKGGRYSVYLNDAFAFLLYRGDLSRYGVEEGKTLSEALYREITEELLLKRARLYTMNLLQKQDRTERDLRRKLKEGLYDEKLIDGAIAYVKDYGYLDDVRYAFQFIRLKASKYSFAEMRGKLAEKGVSREDFEEALAQAKEEGFVDDDAETEAIRRLIRKKCPDPATLSETDRNRLYASLYRKGYAVSAVEKVLEELTLSSTFS
ncbi:MAG: RecX family transcriptional regulator [Lachnospiraceae bacterium]|nr:RecX family transcriptional regulator [Lachnospiraceae bacterium]